MPCSYVIHKERRLVVTTGWGCLTFEEMRAHDDQLRSDPDFLPEFSLLADATRVTAIEGAIEEVRANIRRLPYSSSSRLAFVAPNPAVYGVARGMVTYLELANTSVRACVFHDRPSALKWLGLGDLLETIGPEGAKTEDCTNTAKKGRIA